MWTVWNTAKQYLPKLKKKLAAIEKRGAVKNRKTVHVPRKGRPLQPIPPHRFSGPIQLLYFSLCKIT